MLGLFAIASSTSAAEDDVMPQAKAEAFVKAFNEHDAKAVGSLYTESADFAFLQGSSLETIQSGQVSGRDPITRAVEKFFQINPSAKLTHTVRKARLITPDVMVSDEDFEITKLPGEPGPIKGRLVVIRVRTDGTWKITAERNVSKAPPQK
jgi:uncharacterized protein (TIGR02246 family)